MTPSDSSTSALVSVIVPVYNAAGHLKACVQSILSQTYLHLEVVLINDGSSDGSAELCDELAAADPRVKVWHQDNGGIASAQNTGLKIATGELITFCDNDDLMAPRLLERLAGLMEATDADMSCCRWRNIGASRGGEELQNHRDTPFGEFIVIDDPAKAYQTVFSLAVRRLLGVELRYFSEANWGKLYRAKVFEGIHFPDGHYAQDVAIAMSLYARMRKVTSCDDALYYWLQRGDSVSHGQRSVEYFSDIVRAHAKSFDVARSLRILPARAYTGMMALRLERKSVRSAADALRYEQDRSMVRSRLRGLSFWQRAACGALHLERLLEVVVYNLTVHRRR
ncbi:glycosyl transferase [Microbacterium sp. CH12i]|uniref:glycosyltransferase family 2 protein n=1 Tax=Microbacterium sp. CH12i TaxID=1479651 RepID=UPI000461D642|nr:glycosyltransferase [Microbacterium sp. CH12i]KDA06609.1 glycosyl transferase [Microbacterium sp. CH12i]